MSVSSLSKFTVPLANNQSATTQGLLMPKLKYRFRVSFENFGVNPGDVVELTKQVMDFTRPTLTFGEIEIPVYNSRVYLAGRPTWEAVTVNIRDDAGGNVTKLIGQQLQKQFDFMEQSSAASGVDYKFITRCEMLDGGNGQDAVTVLETWELYGCFITQANYNNADYNVNDPMNITLNIRYDNAIQTPINTGVGSIVARTVGTTITG